MKRQRQEAIIKILRDRSPGSQEELSRWLGRMGFPASQTTVSRDLRELGISRGRDERGRLRYSAGNGTPTRAMKGEPLRRIAPEAMLGVEPTGNIVVIRTPPGGAQGLAWAIDEADLEGAAGTVAGDDTIILVCSEGTEGSGMSRKLMKYALSQG